MAVRGRRPTVTVLRPMKGRRFTPRAGEPMPGGKPECPKYFSGKHRAIWNRHIAPAGWLTRVDEVKCIMFTNALVQYLDDPAMSLGRIRELRFLASDLALDPVSRARLVGGVGVAGSLDRYK